MGFSVLKWTSRDLRMDRITNVSQKQLFCLFSFSVKTLHIYFISAYEPEVSKIPKVNSRNGSSFYHKTLAGECSKTSSHSLKLVFLMISEINQVQKKKKKNGMFLLKCGTGKFKHLNAKVEWWLAKYGVGPNYDERLSWFSLLWRNRWHDHEKGERVDFSSRL